MPNGGVVVQLPNATNIVKAKHTKLTGENVGSEICELNAEFNVVVNEVLTGIAISVVTHQIFSAAEKSSLVKSRFTKCNSAADSFGNNDC